MKSVKKLLVLVLTAMLLVLTLTGCEKSSATVELETKNAIEDQTVRDIVAYTNDTIGGLMTMNSYEDVVLYVAGGNYLVSIPFTNDLMARWAAFHEAHGAVVKAECTEAEADEGKYTSHLVLTGADGETMRLNVSFTETGVPMSTTLEKYADDSGKTLGEKMAEAGMNTLVGLLVVFCVLILLSLIISAFGLIGNTQKKAPKKEETKAAAAEAPQVVAAAKPEEEDVTDDLALVAVIAAAIAASENTTPDGFVVRSIRRLKNNKW